MRSHTKFQTTRTFISSRSRVPGWGVVVVVVVVVVWTVIIMSNPTSGWGYVELSLGWGFDNKCISNRQNVRSEKILVIMSVEKIVFVNVLWIEINHIIKLSPCFEYWSVNARARSARSRPLAAARGGLPAAHTRRWIDILNLGYTNWKQQNQLLVINRGYHDIIMISWWYHDILYL